jgi:hypothetical protein
MYAGGAAFRAARKFSQKFHAVKAETAGCLPPFKVDKLRQPDKNFGG